MMPKDDDGLLRDWAALVQGEQELAQLRARVFRSESRKKLLASGISDPSRGERAVVLSFLRRFPEDAVDLLEPLVDLAISDGWLREATDVIRAGRHRIQEDQLSAVALSRLEGANSDDCERLMKLLAQVQAW